MFVYQAGQWQRVATGWYQQQDIVRGDLCQWMADYWAMPLWRQLWHLRKLERTVGQLEQLTGPDDPWERTI